MNLRDTWRTPEWPSRIRAVYFERVLRGRLIMKSFRDATVVFLGRKKGSPGPWWLWSDKWASYIYTARVNHEKNIRVAPFALSCFLFQASFACTTRRSLWCVASCSLCSLYVACNERRWYQPYTTPANRAVYRATWELSDVGKLGFLWGQSNTR